MKNVAIMTYHDMINYGSFFQMYALQETLKNMNCDVKVINYKPNSNKLKKIIGDSYILRHIWLFFHNDKLWNGFNYCYDKYIKKTNLVSSLKDLKKLNKDFDIFISGSDQIWSPNHYDIHFFLDFVDNDLKRISYAPSVVIDDFNEEKIKCIEKELKKYNSISVRELSSKNIIKKNFNIDADVVLDPTLILDIKNYEKMKKNNKNKTKYDLFCYFLGNNEYEKKIIKIYNEYSFKNIINICINNNPIDFEYIDNKQDANPMEFLDYFINAEMILTDSFHGVALAIKFEKQFIFFDRFSEKDPICQNSRIYDLLNKLDICNTSYNDFLKGEYKKIDYKKVKLDLEREITISKNYLINSIYGDDDLNEKK